MSALQVALGVLALGLVGFVLYRAVDLLASLRFAKWRIAYTRTISREAIRGSQAALSGKVLERVAPYLPDFGFNPRDVRFIGDPVDFVVFDGLSEGDVRRVVFIEVKSGQSELNGSERRVRTAVTSRRVEWTEYRVPGLETSGTRRNGR